MFLYSFLICLNLIGVTCCFKGDSLLAFSFLRMPVYLLLLKSVFLSRVAGFKLELIWGSSKFGFVFIDYVTVDVSLYMMVCFELRSIEYAFWALREGWVDELRPSVSTSD